MDSPANRAQVENANIVVVRPVCYTERPGATLFLDGPTGSLNWQDRVCERMTFTRCKKTIIVANPGSLDGNSLTDHGEWCQHYFQTAMDEGVVLLWYPKDAVCDFGAWVTQHDGFTGNLVVGVEPGFQGEAEVKAYFDKLSAHLIVHPSFEGLCTHAVIRLQAI